MSLTNTVIPKMILKQIKVVQDEVNRLESMMKEHIDFLDQQRGLTPHEADKPHTCPSCSGYGQVRPWGKWVDCTQCNGTGQV